MSLLSIFGRKFRLLFFLCWWDHVDFYPGLGWSSFDPPLFWKWFGICRARLLYLCFAGLSQQGCLRSYCSMCPSHLTSLRLAWVLDHAYEALLSHFWWYWKPSPGCLASRCFWDLAGTGHLQYQPHRQIRMTACACQICALTRTQNRSWASRCDCLCLLF